MGDRRNGATSKTTYKLVNLKNDAPNTESSEEKELPRFGKRHIQSICLFITLTVLLTVRAQLSVTLVAMTDKMQKNVTDNSIAHKLNTSSCNNAIHANSNDLMKLNFFDKDNIVNNTLRPSIINIDDLNDDYTSDIQLFNESHNSNEILDHNFGENGSKIAFDNELGWSVYRTYNWSKSVQEMILGSFFVGYTSMQLPMGIICQRFGGKLPIVLSLFVNGVTSIITPWAAIFSWQLVCSCRLLQGMTQAALLCGTQTMLGKWVPVSERGRLSSFVFTGSQLGTIVAFQLAGFLAGSPTFGWPFTFWVTGAMCLACGVMLMELGAATPADHPTISVAEKQFIMGHEDEFLHQAKKRTPMKAILKSVPVWAMIAAHAGSSFAYVFLLMQMPVYMSKILHVDIENNGIFSSLPYVAMYVVGLVSGQLSDCFINRGYISTINARRVANSIGMVACGMFMVGAAYASSVTLAVTLLVLSMASHSGVHVGFIINQIDLTTNFAGTLMSLSNMVAAFVSLGAPVLVSLLVTDMQDQSQWQLVFLITAGVMIITNVFFVVFIKVDVQRWNDPDYSKDVASEDFDYEKFPEAANKMQHHESKL